MLYRRIFSLRIQWFRIAWWANMFFATSIGLVLLILGVTGCSPHPLSRAEIQKGSCKRDSSSAAVMGFMNAASDFSIFVLPIRICWSLRLSQKQRFGIIAVFGLCLMYVSCFTEHSCSTRSFNDYISTVAVSIARAIAIATGGISLGGESHLPRPRQKLKLDCLR